MKSEIRQNMVLKKVNFFKRSLLIIFLSVISHTKTARILAYYPFPSISHQNVFRPLTLELIKRGHEVTVITTDPIFPKGKTPTNLTEIDFHDLSYKIWNDLLTGNKNDMPSQVGIIYDLMNKICEAHFENEQVKNIIDNRRNDFDLLLLESCVRPPLGFTHIMKVPVIHVSSFGNWVWNYENAGAPTHPIFYPTTTTQRSYNLSFWEKILEYLNFLHIKYVSFATEEIDLKMMRKHFGADLPDFKVLMGNVDLLFLNVHRIWENNRPVPSNVVYMGGIHINPPKELPAELKSYLDSSKNGVIYMSFGTNTKPSLLPPNTIKIFTNVFSRLPYDVIWKWDMEKLPGNPKNVRIQKWLPQPDVLRHPKAKFFITQGGLQSIDEAITAGVPMLGIPMRADQFFNVANIVKHGIGVHLDLSTITESVFKDAIDKILSNDSYAKNMVKLRNLMHDQPQKPLDRAIWWIEHVLRHKSAKHLKPPTANMSLLEYIQIDLIAAVFTLALLLGFAAYLFVSFLFNTYKSKLMSTVKIKVK